MQWIHADEEVERWKKKSNWCWVPVSNTCRLTLHCSARDDWKSGDKSHMQKCRLFHKSIVFELANHYAFHSAYRLLKANVLRWWWFFFALHLSHAHTHTVSLLEIEKSSRWAFVLHFVLLLHFPLSDEHTEIKEVERIKE